MTPIEALKLLGSKRVIWIDDCFATATTTELVDLLTANAEEIQEICPTSVQEPLRKIAEGDEAGNHELEQAVVELPERERITLLQKIQLKLENNGSSELSDVQIKSVCNHLSIADEDRWSFDKAEAAMLKLANEGDAEISYIIDLNDFQGTADNARGLELLNVLHSAKSKATALLLTHYATKCNEAEKEQELRSRLLQDGSKDVSPVCVIAKERLYSEDLDTTDPDEAVVQALCIAIKRAGLRRNVHEVLLRVHNHIYNAFEQASNALLEVPPEQLDEYVIDRAYAEGVSELHVVERALSASMSESFRQLFSVNRDTRENERRLRLLREIPLGIEATTHHPNLDNFRRQEVWETAELVNGGCSPLACGDVFETDATNGTSPNRFILLVQPCDVTLRPNGKRDSETGFLVFLKPLDSVDSSVSQKQVRLPFLLDGKQWVCELRKTTSAKLKLLDLVTYRVDGRLQYEANQSVENWLLPGQQASGRSVLGGLKTAFTARSTAKSDYANDVKDSRCQLTLSAQGAFKPIAHGCFIEPKPANDGEAEVKGGFTWNLRRIGRVRMPYASALLGSYLAIMDRDAFDLDYLKPRPTQAMEQERCSTCT